VSSGEQERTPEKTATYWRLALARSSPFLAGH
jgi:hypothetical protein